MPETYMTQQGDTWDGVAYKLFGSERHMHELLLANWPLLDYLVFPNGVTLNVPEIPEPVNENLPFWRQ